MSAHGTNETKWGKEHKQKAPWYSSDLSLLNTRRISQLPISTARKISYFGFVRPKEVIILSTWSFWSHLSRDTYGKVQSMTTYVELFFKHQSVYLDISYCSWAIIYWGCRFKDAFHGFPLPFGISYILHYLFYPSKQWLQHKVHKVIRQINFYYIIYLFVKDIVINRCKIANRNPPKLVEWIKKLHA